LPDRILAGGKELLYESFVDYCDRARRCRVARPDAAAHHHPRADRIEVLRVGLDVGSVEVQLGLALYDHAPAVVVVLHGRVAADADSLDTGQRVEAIFHGSIELSHLPLRIARRLRID